MLLRHLIKRDSDKMQIIRSFSSSSKIKNYSGLYEIPRSSILLALGGFELKVYPKFIIRLLTRLHKIFGIPLNYVMHSLDAIDIHQSKTSKICSAREFEARLDSFIKDSKRYFDFVKTEDLI